MHLVHYEENVEDEMVHHEERVEEEKLEGMRVADVIHGGWACEVEGEGEGEGEREVGEEGLEGDGEVKPDSSRR